MTLDLSIEDLELILMTIEGEIADIHDSHRRDKDPDLAGDAEMIAELEDLKRRIQIALRSRAVLS